MAHSTLTKSSDENFYDKKVEVDASATSYPLEVEEIRFTDEPLIKCDEYRSRSHENRLSGQTIKANYENIVMNRDLIKGLCDEAVYDLRQSREFDAKGMLQKFSKELKLTDYKLNQCLTSGTEHFTHLRVTTAEEVQTYREHLTMLKKQQNGELQEQDF